MSDVKVVNGIAYPHQDFIRMLAQTIDRIGGEIGASAKEITEAWGDPHWLEPVPRKVLSNLLKRMVTRRLLEYPSRGRFLVARRYREIGNTSRERVERDIAESIIERGGICKYSEVRRDFDIEPRKRKYNDGGEVIETEEDAQDVYLQSVIGKSRMIGRDLARRNRLNINYSILDNLPLEGRHAATLSRRGYDSVRPAINGDTFDQADMQRRDALEVQFFAGVGLVYRTAREMREIDYDAIVEDSEAYDALDTLAAYHPDRIQYREYLAGEIDEPQVDAVKLFRDAKALRQPWAEVVLALFEQGDPTTHMQTRMGFYMTFADLYGIDPVMASRGLLVPAPQLPRMSYLERDHRP